MVYSNEMNAQIIVALLKQHGVRRVIASPGTTNYGLVGSMQADCFFEMYSSVDERSAAYMACGMAAVSGEPVVLTCTGATASRDYLPGLTEAYYRKLPVIAITSFNGTQSIGQLLPQNIDRMNHQNDVSTYSVDVPVVKDEADEVFVNRVVNEAIIACTRHGGGPVHINVSCNYADGGFGVEELPRQRVIRRHDAFGELPSMDGYNKIAVFIGAHVPFSKAEAESLERFSKTRNVAVLVDHTSNFSGSRSILSSLAAENTSRWSSDYSELRPDLVIDLGEVSGDYVTTGFLKATGAECWRVSEDGEVRDRFGSLTNVFEMHVREFFLRYAGAAEADCGYHDAWRRKDGRLRDMLPSLPLTNRWCALELAPLLPAGGVLHMAILNSLRSWNYAEVDSSIACFCDTGGFGIDGCLSSAIGSALATPERLTLLVTGDLAFFYDMNALGNRDLPRNLRILLVNNGLGVEFHMPYSPAAVMGDDVNRFVAAQGHFSNRFGPDPDGLSPAALWCRAMGIRYAFADSKEAFKGLSECFLKTGDVPMLLEVAVDPHDEKSAAKLMASIDPENASRRGMVDAAKRLVPKGLKSAIKSALS